jgi:phosphoglycerol transferase
VRYGLSVSTMVRPTPYHRFKGLIKQVLGRGETGASLAEQLNDLNENENRFVALGVFGTCGFLTLIAVPFLVRKPPGLSALFDPLGRLNLAGVLLGMPGGLGHLVALYLTPNIRAYNRISIYLAYFSVLAVALLLDRLRRWAVDRPRPRHLFGLALAMMLAIGLVDQMPRALIPDYAAARTMFARDHEFFGRVEAALPAGSMVFQLPYAPFPEGYSDARADDWSYLGYEHIRPYFHTDRLRWSSPTMKGREWDRWQGRLWKEPVERVVEELNRVGFRGISVDRDGYDDRGDKTIAELRRLLGSEPLESPDHRFIFFPLKPASSPAAIASPE